MTDQEIASQLEILEGRREPANDQEREWQDLIAFPRPKDLWPQKWVTCSTCHADWFCTGIPAGRQNRFTDSIDCYHLKDSDGFVWLWSRHCHYCVDYKTAKPTKKPKTEQEVRLPYAN